VLKQIVYNLLEFISPALVVITFLFLHRNSKLIRHLRLLLLYFVLSSINLGIATYLAIDDTPNLFWYNLNGFCSLLTLSMFFYTLVQGKRYKQIIGILSIIGLGTYLAMLYFWNDNNAFFSSGYAVSSLLIIIYCLLFLNEVFMDKAPISHYTDQTIGVVSGLFTYFLCAYVIHVAYRYFTREVFKDNQVKLFFDRGALWGVHNIIYFLACLFILVNLFRMRKAEVPAS
jgi:hypothetical protein